MWYRTNTAFKTYSHHYRWLTDPLSVLRPTSPAFTTQYSQTLSGPAIPNLIGNFIQWLFYMHDAVGFHIQLSSASTVIENFNLLGSFSLNSHMSLVYSPSTDSIKYTRSAWKTSPDFSPSSIICVATMAL